MNGQGTLEIIALVVSSIVIVGMALVLGITFYLYSKYKKKHIEFGHEDNEIKKETKEKYSKYISMMVYDEFILPYKSYEHLFYKIDTGIDLDAIKQETKTIETSRKTRTSFDENEKYDGNYELYLQELVSNYEVKEEIKPEVIVDDIKVIASSNSSFAKEISYEIECNNEITENDINVEWQTIMGDTNFTKENQITVAVITISSNGEVISQRKVNFISKAVDIIVDTINKN